MQSKFIIALVLVLAAVVLAQADTLSFEQKKHLQERDEILSQRAREICKDASRLTCSFCCLSKKQMYTGGTWAKDTQACECDTKADRHGEIVGKV